MRRECRPVDLLGKKMVSTSWRPGLCCPDCVLRLLQGGHAGVEVPDLAALGAVVVQL